ncbi:hypothetical protein EYC80_006851 [Monilinia laxa]|uniref:Uncharacterized protein n=1 Tax=Monilinia laxa TaxID=61186 RepID=A0A5N6JZC9_MONLA|nr:hypothetical protein EYC80_006851 [Monilinia laxa]
MLINLSVAIHGNTECYEEPSNCTVSLDTLAILNVLVYRSIFSQVYVATGERHLQPSRIQFYPRDNYQELNVRSFSIISDEWRNVFKITESLENADI